MINWLNLYLQGDSAQVFKHQQNPHQRRSLMKYLKWRILAKKSLLESFFTECIPWRQRLRKNPKLPLFFLFFFALKSRESQTWDSPGHAESLSHLDGVAADSCGPSEASALLTRQHKQLGEPLLHQTGKALVLSLQAAVVYVLDHFKAQHERREVVTWLSVRVEGRGAGPKKVIESWPEQRKGRPQKWSVSLC